MSSPTAAIHLIESGIVALIGGTASEPALTYDLIGEEIAINVAETKRSAIILSAKE